MMKLLQKRVSHMFFEAMLCILVEKGRQLPGISDKTIDKFDIATKKLLLQGVIPSD